MLWSTFGPSKNPLKLFLWLMVIRGQRYIVQAFGRSADLLCVCIFRLCTHQIYLPAVMDIILFGCIAGTNVAFQVFSAREEHHISGT
jgi:hypothetical protein